MKFFAFILLIVLASCGTTSESDRAALQGKVKARVHKAFYSTVLGYQPYAEVHIKYIDSMYKKGDVIELPAEGGKTMFIVDSVTYQP